MSLVAVLNSQPEVQKLVERALSVHTSGDTSGATSGDFEVVQATSAEMALEILAFDLPEIVLWNASDPTFGRSFIETLQTDSWMHNFGIVAFYDPAQGNEVDANQRLGGVNVLTLLSLGALGEHLLKHLAILDANRQIVVRLEVPEQGIAKSTGSFNIPNDPSVVPVYAALAAQTLVQRGYLVPEKKKDLQIALVELIQNGIEHGNLGLSSAEKAEFLAHGGNLSDLIRTKIEAEPALGHRRVTLEWEIQPSETRFYVRDQGAGFDVEAYLEAMRSRTSEALSGRGIHLARNIGGRLSYNRKGNVACLRLEHHPSVQRVPRGFEGEEVVGAQKGDVVFEQGEHSDHVFYIVSGQFGVYHGGIPVALLTPADVFMGEMSFLMNNTRTATVICESSGRLVKISRRSFVMTLRQYPQYGIFLAKLMARKLTQGNQDRAKRVISELGGTDKLI